MKKRFLFGIVVLMILATCLLVSCNSEVSTTAQAGDGKLVYASFSKGNTKSIEKPTETTVTQSYNLVDINEVYWFFKSEKADGGGTTGQVGLAAVKGETPSTGLDGVIGPFSAGKWNFTIYGYKKVTTGDAPDVSHITVTYGNVDYHFTEKVFEGSTVGGVFLTTGTRLNPDPINIKVELQTGDEGTLSLDASNYKFFWYGDGGNVENLKMDFFLNDATTRIASVDMAYVAASSPDVAYYKLADNQTTSWSIDGGDYILKVVVYYTVGSTDDVTVATVENIPLKIYSGQETIIGAEVLEGNLVYAKINAAMNSTAVARTVTNTTPTVFTTSYTPASITTGSVKSDEVTTVTFVAGDLMETGTVIGEPETVDGKTSTNTVDSYKLDVSVHDITSAQTQGLYVQDEETETPVASIDATLFMTVKTTIVNDSTSEIIDTSTDIQKVTEYTGNVVKTLVTYIVPGLDDVAVYYDQTRYAEGRTTGDGFDYDKQTGKLTVYTTHFSTFHVSTTSEAYNVQKGRAYRTIMEAVGAVDANETIQLLKDCTSTNQGLVFNDSGVVFDLNGKTLTVERASGSNPKSIEITSDVTFKNGVIKGTLPEVSGKSYCAVYVMGGSLTLNDVDVSVNDNPDNDAQYAVAVLASGTSEDNPVSLTINGGTFDGIVGTNGQYRYNKVTITDGTFNDGVYFPAHGKYVISGGTFNGSVEIKSGSLSISGGSYNYASVPQTYTPNWNGTTVEGCSLVAVNYDGEIEGTEYGPRPSVSITGGTFAGKIGLATEDSDDQYYPNLYVSGINPEVVYFAGSEDALENAISSDIEGCTVILTDNITITSIDEDEYDGNKGFGIFIQKDLVIEGNNKTISGSSLLNTPRALIGVKGDADGSSVVFNNLTVEGGSKCSKGIETRGNINEIVLSNSTVDCSGYQSGGSDNFVQALTIGGSNTSDFLTLTRVNVHHSTIKTSELGNVYYAVMIWNPVNIVIDSLSHVYGWACIYFKEGSNGSEVLIENSTLQSVGNDGYSNTFGMFTFEDENISVIVKNSDLTIDSSATQSMQTLAMFSSWTKDLSLSKGNTVTINGGSLSLNGSSVVPSIDCGILNSITISNVSNYENYHYDSLQGYESALCFYNNNSTPEKYVYVINLGDVSENMGNYYTNAWTMLLQDVSFDENALYGYEEGYNLILSLLTRNHEITVTGDDEHIMLPSDVSIITDHSIIDILKAPAGYHVVEAEIINEQERVSAIESNMLALFTYIYYVENN